jgi:hypothetical protein
MSRGGKLWQIAHFTNNVSAVQSGTGEFRRVQDDAEGKQIATRIQFFCPRLLRRHVSNRAERETGAGEMIRVHRARLRVKRPCARVKRVEKAIVER